MSRNMDTIFGTVSPHVPGVVTARIPFGPSVRSPGRFRLDTPGVSPLDSLRRRVVVPGLYTGARHGVPDGSHPHGVCVMAQRRQRGRNAPASHPEPEKPKAKPPIFRVRSGSLKVSVWKNEGQYGDMYSAKIVSVYKDKDDQWQETGSIDGRDLPALALACQEAFAEILVDRGQGVEDGECNDGDGDDKPDDIPL